MACATLRRESPTEIAAIASFLDEQVSALEQSYDGVVLGRPQVYLGLADLTRGGQPELFVGAADNTDSIWFVAYRLDLRPLGLFFEHKIQAELFESRRYRDNDGQDYYLARTVPRSAMDFRLHLTKIWLDGEEWRTERRTELRSAHENTDPFHELKTCIVKVNPDTVEADVASAWQAYWEK